MSNMAEFVVLANMIKAINRNSYWKGYHTFLFANDSIIRNENQDIPLNIRINRIWKSVYQ